MRQDVIKLELIEWLKQIHDTETIEYLKALKDSFVGKNDWWDDLGEVEKQGIERGLNDIKQGRTVSHFEVKKKYGL